MEAWVEALAQVCTQGVRAEGVSVSVGVQL
jgi:hypothetical protein